MIYFIRPIFLFQEILCLENSEMPNVKCSRPDYVSCKNNFKGFPVAIHRHQSVKSFFQYSVSVEKKIIKSSMEKPIEH